jgi:dolichol-phosphate mannosyltransferase
MEPIELSVVVPVYGCADCLLALHERLTRSVTRITDRYELVFVDDRSLDHGWAVLGRLAAGDPHVRAFRLSRNFGQDAAITAGLAKARGDWAFVMDCDLQEAPEDLPRLWAAAGEGYEIVRSVRRGWSHSAFRRWSSRLYRRLTLETDVRPDYSNLSLLSRRVVDAFLQLRDRDREYMIALDWLGFDSTSVEIEHHDRHSGDSGYTIRKLLQTALNGMFFRSTVLLRLVVLVGFVIAVVGIAIAIFEIGDYFLEPEKAVPGYTSIAVLLLVLAGFIIVAVGVVGLYVGRIFEQVKNRPLFLIDAELGGPEASTAHTSAIEAIHPVVASDPLSIPDPDERRARTPSPARPES